MRTPHFADLPQRGKEPATKRALNTWIQQAHTKTGIAVKRLGWIVASTVVVAALQRTRHTDGQPRFLLKGGTYLEHKFGLEARATRDVDTLFRGNFDEFLETLDDTLSTSWGVLELRRTEVEVIERSNRLVKPRRFQVKLLIRGAVWRSITVEVSADEGKAGTRVDTLVAPALDHFGLPSVLEIAGISLDYQVAQKLHACTDPHLPPDRTNYRVRDIVDLLLVRDELYMDNADLASLKGACVDLFTIRAEEAAQLGATTSRFWPPIVRAYEPWYVDYPRYAEEVGLAITLDDAVGEIQSWVERIDNSRMTDPE